MKRLLGLVLVLTMILSCFALNVNAAGCNIDITATGNNGEVGEVIYVTAKIQGISTLFMGQITLKYDPAVVVPANVSVSPAEAMKFKSDGTATAANIKKTLSFNAEGATFGADEYDGDYEDGPVWGQKQYYADSAKGYIGMMLSAAGSESDSLPAIVTGDGYTLFTMAFLRNAAGNTGIGIADDGRHAAAPAGAVIEDTEGNVVASGAVAFTTSGVVDVENGGDDPIDPPADDKQFKDAVASTENDGTLTFAGKVDAADLDKAYGIIVEGNKFFGAKSGDMVSDGADGVTEFTFGDWDGTFEIILKGIKVKGTDGVKTYQYFVGDTLTEAANVTVE